MREKINPVTLWQGSIYDASGRIIENPAVLVDPEGDCFHGWGENTAISRKLDDVARKSGGLFRLTMVDLSKLPKDMACYVILRMIQFTASGFIKNFVGQAENPAAMDWLRNEMQRVPVSIPDTMPAY